MCVCVGGTGESYEGMAGGGPFSTCLLVVQFKCIAERETNGEKKALPYPLCLEPRTPATLQHILHANFPTPPL